MEFLAPLPFVNYLACSDKVDPVDCGDYEGAVVGAFGGLVSNIAVGAGDNVVGLFDGKNVMGSSVSTSKPSAGSVNWVMFTSPNFPSLS